MQKIISIFFLCLYACATSDAVVDAHYCGAQLHSISLHLGNASNVADACGMKMNKNFPCSDKKVKLQISADRQLFPTDYGKYFTPVSAAVAYPFLHQEIIFSENGKEPIVYANAPPGGVWRKMPLYKLYHCFVYYDNELSYYV